MQLLGIDVGGSGTKGAIVETTTGELLVERLRLETPRPATPKAMGVTLERIRKHFQWTGPIGVGFPAAIQHGVARTAANVDPSFIGLPITDFFAKQTGSPVFVANDADVAGLAEMRFGAGKDSPGVVLIVTIGTGLGTAIFSKGQLVPNTEVGHIYLDNAQEAERYASDAARINQELKWKEWGERFNHYLRTMESLFWPDLIILGGGTSKKLHKFSSCLTVKSPVVAASFLNQAGIVGAALFAEESLR